jgi:multiple sugar transport system permease protein
LTLLTTQSNGRWELIQAGAVISVIPMILIFLVGQEHFIQGIARTGLKG